jgi:hypothetical protein
MIMIMNNFNGKGKQCDIQVIFNHENVGTQYNTRIQRIKKFEAKMEYCNPKTLVKKNHTYFLRSCGIKRSN